MIDDSALDDMIAQFAVEQGLILPADLEKARQTQRTAPSPVTLTEVMCASGMLTSEQLGEMTRRIRPATAPTSRVVIAGAPGPLPEQIKEAMQDPRRRVGKYVLLEEIGRGGMGIVRRAWDASLERLVAIKCLPATAEAEDLARFRREAQTAGRLSHSNIVPIHEILEHEGALYVVMELIDGKRLDQVAHDYRRIALLMRDAAVAIQFAHDKGVVHRDLKPANLMTDTTGRVWVMDFGIARAVAPGRTLTATGIIQGTPSYMSPEHATGAACTPLSDVYSLGATLYDLLTGELPFTAENPLEILRQIVNEDPVPPRKRKPDIPMELETITLKCLEKRPDRRYASAAALAADLDRWLNGHAILAHPPSTFYRLVKFVQRRRAAAAVAFLVLLIGGYAAVTVSRRAGAFRRQVELARQFESDGEIGSARDAWRKALDLDPGCAEAKQGFERMEAALRSRDERLQADAADARSKLKAREEAAALLERARIALDQAARRRSDGRDYREVVEIVTRNQGLIEEAIRKAPDYAVGHHLLGQAWSLRGEDALSESSWRKAIQLDPGYAAPHLELGRLLLFRGFDAMLESAPEEAGDRDPARVAERVAEAGREFKAFSTLAEGSSQPMVIDLARAMEAYARNDGATVRKFLEEAKRRYGASIGMEEFYCLEGLLLGHASAALDAYSRALEIRPNYFEALYGRGCEYQAQGAFEEAVEDFSKAVVIKPKYAPAWMQRGLALRKLGELRKALADLDRAAKLAPEDAYVQLNRGVLHLDLRELEAAEKILTDVILRQPKWALAHELRGTARGMMDDPEGALADFSKAIELHPTARAYRNRGGAHQELGKDDAALKDYRAGLKLAPEGSPEREYLLDRIEELDKRSF